MTRHLLALTTAMGLALGSAGFAAAQDDAGNDALRAAITADYEANLEGLYRHFHAHPELSHQEHETAARLASELRALGYDVTEGVGGTGIVAVLENGEGPTLMLRADMDGLPVPEQTGLSYASTDTDVDHRGVENPVMHACAHDTHMTALVGAARQLIENQDDWSGTLVLIGQPAEELGEGAIAMIEDGLFERFPTPDFNLSFHTFSAIPTGTITYVPGYAMANVDSVDIYVHGRGGHGAYPHTTKDPIYLASMIVVNLQSLVSRELSPLEPGVVTVGAFNAGAKHNIISDQAHLQLTVRSYSDETRELLLSGIPRPGRRLRPSGIRISHGRGRGDLHAGALQLAGTGGSGGCHHARALRGRQCGRDRSGDGRRGLLAIPPHRTQYPDLHVLGWRHHAGTPAILRG